MMPCGSRKNNTIALRARKCNPPLVAGATTFPPRWEACHWILSRLRLPANPVPLPPPQFGGAAKGKRLNGQARRLTSPHLEVLCRTSTGDYKAPLCCELLMKELLCGSLLSHRSAGGRWCRKAPKGGGSHQRWLITRIPIIPYDTESKSRNADFISIARRAIHHLQRRRRCRPLSEANTTLLHNLRRSRHHHPLNPLNPHAVGVSHKPGPLCGL